jgi:acyl carrier protein
MSEVFDKVKEIIIDHLGVDESAVKMEASLVDDLKADSLDTVEMIMSLEEEFSIDIEDSEAESLKTVGDAVRFIEERSRK